ncbi:hypothetical protein FACS189487_03240 [Campylobacterota bacterium]|nr:hypothetical protein FACS189487_03240 [Campylobacterota bacterium]
MTGRGRTRYDGRDCGFRRNDGRAEILHFVQNDKGGWICWCEKLKASDVEFFVGFGAVEFYVFGFYT